MSAPISDVVQVTVSVESAVVQAQGFGKALVLATHAHWTDRTREYGAVSEMVTDGFSSTSAAYLAALAYFSQEPAPTKIKIGRRQVDALNIAITVANSFDYVLTINGVEYEYTSDGSATEQEIVDGLITAIAASPVTGSDGGANTLTLTADVAGTAFSVSMSANLAFGTLTAADTITEDLDAILLTDTDFYGLILATNRLSADMQLAAAWVSANKRVLFAATAEANVINVVPASDTTTLPAILKAAAYDRVNIFYHADAATVFIDAAVAGYVLSKQPGSYTLNLKTLIGIAVSVLTPTQRANALGKNCNVFETRGGINQVNDGRMSSAKFMDQIHGRDWLASQIQTNVFGLLSSVAKVPFTDDGIGLVQQQVQKAGALGVDRNYLESYEIEFPLVTAISANDKAARLLSGGTMVALESGAIHSVTFAVTVQV
jgi:hypothetical protein